MHTRTCVEHTYVMVPVNEQLSGHSSLVVLC